MDHYFQAKSPLLVIEETHICGERFCTAAKSTKVPNTVKISALYHSLEIKALVILPKIPLFHS